MSAEQKLLDMIRTFLPEVPATIHDLKQPTGYFSCQIYTAILEELGVTKTLKNTQHDQLQVITYSDMFADTIPYINVCGGIKFFMRRIGIEDFGLHDLLYPEPKRNLHLMTKLLHFISYADMMIGRLRSEEHIALKIKRDDLLIRTEELRTHINQRVSECARNNNLIATQGKSADDLKNRLIELTAKKENIQKQIEDAQKRSLDRVETLKKYRYLEKKFTDELATLEVMDEEMPDNVVSKIDQLFSSRDDLKNNTEIIINQTAEKKRIISFIYSQTTCVEECHKHLLHLCDLLKTVCEIEKELNSYSEQLKHLNDQQAEVIREGDLTSDDRSNLCKSIQELETYNKRMKEQQEERLNSLNNECEQLKISQFEMKTCIKEYEEKLRELNDKKSECQIESTKFNETVQRALCKITTAEGHTAACAQIVTKYATMISELEQRAGIKFNTIYFT